MGTFELKPINGRKSFYGKAKVCQDGDLYTLISYGTPVCKYNVSTGDFTRLWAGYSLTTLTHVNAFLDAVGVDHIAYKAWWIKLEVAA